MDGRGRQEEVLFGELLLELSESRTFSVFFQRLLVLISRAGISEMVCVIFTSDEIPLDHADNLGTVFAWAHRRVGFVAAGIFLVLLNMCCCLLDQVQHLFSLSIRRALWLELLAHLLRLSLPGSDHRDDIYFARWHGRIWEICERYGVVKVQVSKLQSIADLTRITKGDVPRVSWLVVPAASAARGV